jgi:folate-dependent tRNA-U54 methylase TrmFO/GidA
MRPAVLSRARHTGEIDDLVCSSSYESLSSDRAAGLLQEKFRRLGSLVIGTADIHPCSPAVPSLSIAAATALLSPLPWNSTRW